MTSNTLNIRGDWYVAKRLKAWLNALWTVTVVLVKSLRGACSTTDTLR